MSIILVTVVQTIIVPIANVDSRYTIAIVAREQIAKARSTLRLAVLWRLIGTIAAIVVAIAIPRRRYTPMTRTPETVLRTRSLATMQGILIRIIAAIIITIAQPIRFHANVRILAFQMTSRTRSILRAHFVRLIGRCIVLAVVHTVADLRLWNASAIQARELTVNARRIRAALLVRSVLAVVLMIAFPRIENAPSVIAAELVRSARMERTIVHILIAAIAAIVVAIA